MTNRVSCNGVTISAVKSMDGLTVNPLSHRLYANGTDVASNDSYSILLQLAGGARLFGLDPLSAKKPPMRKDQGVNHPFHIGGVSC